MRNYPSIQQLQQDIDAGLVTCTKLVEYYLQNINKSAEINAFLEVYNEEALERAATLDLKPKDQRGLLYGVVLSVKDVICHKGHKVSASSKILKDYVSPFTATALQRVLDEDAIIIGRVGCDEFAMGSSNENSAYGAILNPINTTKVPGGSSGGSAASVRADCCIASLGSDTGGSVRQPSAFCGLVGYKPTYGTISRYGLIAYASSFDQIGPITRCVEDAALLTQIMSGTDPNDNTTLEGKLPLTTSKSNNSKLKIAIINEAINSKGLDAEIRQGVLTVCESLKKEGHIVEFVDFPLLEYLIPTYYVLTTAEASSNLSRFDGIRYGHRAEGNYNLKDLYTVSRTEGFGKEVKRRIMLGTFVLSAGYFDAYYRKAQQLRRLISEQTHALFANYDVLLSPTVPSPAFGIGEKIDDPISVYLSDIYTVHANLSGCPAVSLPIFGHSSNLPYGLHVTAAQKNDSQLFSIAESISHYLPSPTHSTVK